MAKYNLGSSSDMRRFQRDMGNAIKGKAKEAALKKEIPIECPFCKSKFNAVSGLNVCPSCNKTIDLKLNFDF